MNERAGSSTDRKVGADADLCACTKGKVAAVLAPFQGQRGSLIPVLQQVQGALGYLPPEALAEIARFLRLPPAQVYGVATFYAQFRFEPRGKHMVKVCRGTACHVRGATQVLEAVEKELGVKAGRTTPDMQFSLEEVACFGSCGLAPVMAVDDEFYGRLTTASVKKVLGTTKRAGTE